MTWALVAAVALAASGDNLRFHKDCSEYVAHYRALVQDAAARDAAEAPAPRDASPVLVRVERSEDRARGASARVEARVKRSCRVANRSQYECVVQAQLYEDLRACGIAALPVLNAAERHAAPAPPPPSPEQRARATESFARDWASRGEANVEALGTGSGAQPEERAGPESDVAKGGR